MNVNSDPADRLIEADSADVTEPVSPGALRGEIWLTLQTHQALILVHGRDALSDKPAIVGLTGFADRLRIIWTAARHDDPYADWWLLKVDAAIDAAASLIRSHQSAVAEQLDQFIPMAIAIAMSDSPARIRLRFANPYAYQAARLLARFDELICAVVTANHVGLIDTARRAQIQHACARKLRSLFMLPLAYRKMKLDRPTVQTRTGRAHEARQKMGEVPDEVLSGERRAPFAPRRWSSPTMTLPTRSEPTVSEAPPHDDENNDNR